MPTETASFAANVRADPCPYCACSVEADRETCASCGKTLPPLPDIKLVQTQSLFRVIANVICSFIFVVASVGAVFTFFVFAASLGFGGYLQQEAVPFFITLLLVVAFSYYGHAHFRPKPAEK